MSDSGTKGLGTRIVPAPLASDPRLRYTILDVVCGLNEEVQWHWTMTEHGRFVSGCSIVRRPYAPHLDGAIEGLRRRLAD